MILFRQFQLTQTPLMKTPRLLVLLAATLLCAAPPPSASAAEVVVDISSFAPRDADVVVRQIELNVAIKQYEKVLMEAHEARLQLGIGPTGTGQTDEQQKEWYFRADRKVSLLEKTAAVLRNRISELVKEANEKAREIEKQKLNPKTENNADLTPAKRRD